MYASRYIDETFDINNCQSYILSIQCALDGFSFSVLEEENNRFIVLSEYELNSGSDFELNNEIKRLIQSEPILLKKFKQVRIVYLTTQSVLIPSSLYKSKHVDDFADLSFELSNTETTVQETVADNLVIMSVIPEPIKNTFQALFENCIILPSGSGLMTYSLRQEKGSLRLIAAKLNHTLQLLVLKEGNIVAFNSFFVKDENDCLYYILNFAKQSGLDKHAEINLLGQILPKSMLWKLLKKYFNKVELAPLGMHYQIASPLLKNPKHYHITLFELALCE